jgi:hypothetical protein
VLVFPDAGTPTVKMTMGFGGLEVGTASPRRFPVRVSSASCATVVGFIRRRLVFEVVDGSLMLPSLRSPSLKLTDTSFGIFCLLETKITNSYSWWIVLRVYA